MANNCKYYKQQRYVSYNSGVTWQPLEQYQMGELYEQNSPDCGDSSVDYRWVSVENGYMCDGKNRYGKEIQQITYDGIYWYNVFPTVYRKGSLIESNSPLCDNAGQGQYESGSTNPTSGDTSGGTECPKYYHWNGSECVCDTSLDSQGNCIVCEGNYEYDSNTKTCVCQGNKVMINGVCQECPPGTTRIGNSCVSIQYLRPDPLKLTKCDSEDGILTQEEVNYYQNGWTLLSYQVGDCITEIGESAFNGHIALTSVTIPDSVVQIDRLAFANCRSLPNITIPSGVTTYGDNMFVDCISLQNVNIEGSITTVPTAMFANCYALNSVAWLGYNNITDIGDKAFKNCNSITNVTLPQTLQTIGSQAFQGCNMANIDIPSGVTSIGSLAFASCKSLTSATINSSAATIGNQAFFGCYSLAKITFTSEIPPTIIGNIIEAGNENTRFIVPCDAINVYKTEWPQFEDRIYCDEESTNYRWITDTGFTCVNYDEYTTEKKQQTTDYVVWVDVVPSEKRAGELITHYSRNCGYSGEVALTVYGNDGYTRYYEPCSENMTINRTMTNNANLSAATNVDVGSCVTTIGDNAFSGYSNLTNISIPSGLTYIGSGAFSDCSGLTEITFGDDVTYIGDYAFLRCKGLSSFTIPQSVSGIGYAAFEGTSLSSITIPDNVKTIGDEAFGYLSTLQTVEIGSGITNIGRNAFNNSSGLTSITFNATTPPTLWSGAFSNTNNCPIYVPYESVNAYKNATGWSNYASRIQSIPFKAVMKTSADTSVMIACDSSTTITNDEVLDNYISYKYEITDVIVGSCVDIIDNNAFSYGYALSSITIDDSVSDVYSNAFDYCTNVKQLKIGSGVTTIGDYAFYGESGMTSLELPNSLTYIGEGAFMRWHALSALTIPSGVTTIMQNAFIHCSGLTSITVEATTPPVLVGSSGCFDDTNNCPIFVPNGTSEYYKLLWSRYADRIQDDDKKLKFTVSSGTTYELECDDDPYTGGLVAGYMISDVYPNYKTDMTSAEIGKCVDTIGTYAFQGCRALSSFTFNEDTSLATIIDNAFSGCTSLSSITIPSSVTTIENRAFKGCTSLQSITVEATTPPSLGSAVFDSTNNCPILVPAASVNAYKSASGWSTYSSRIQSIGS